jgi:hypothetical protein
MTTATIKPPTTDPPIPDVNAAFQRLSSMWQRDVLFLSSSQARENHLAYRQIIALGPAVLPYLLRDLEERQTHWFGALKSITGADPVPPQHAGQIGLMADAWLKWARERGLHW